VATELSYKKLKKEFAFQIEPCWWRHEGFANMPKRTDIHSKFSSFGAGPIIIGQACEFDYSGTQACKALREEGYRIVLVNSNPATIMTDPEFADRTYIEPITPECVEKIIARERRRCGAGREGQTGPAAHARRADRPQHGHGPASNAARWKNTASK
jgi:hypothetical protein